jgi:hypothetical protein
MTGFRFFETEEGAPLEAQMGSGQLPSGLESVLGHMTKGERSVFVVDASLMKPGTDSGVESQRQRQPCLMPEPPAKASQVELEIELISLVQVSREAQ